MDSARCRAQSPQHGGRQEETNKQASRGLGDAQTKPDANGLVEERSGEGWERQEKVDGLVTAVGEMQPGQKWKRILKQQNGSLYQDWEAGGRWQVVKVGQDVSGPRRGRSGMGPDFYRVAGRTGAKHDAHGAVTAASQSPEDRETDLRMSRMEGED